MTIQLLGALLLAFLVVLFFGMRFIPWLKKIGAEQPLKNEVKEKIYSKTKN